MGFFPRLNLLKAHFIVGPYCSMLLDKWAPTGVIKIRNVTVNRFFFQPTCVLTGHTATILSSLPFPIQLPPLPFLNFHNPTPLPPSHPCLPKEQELHESPTMRLTTSSSNCRRCYLIQIKGARLQG